MRETTKIGFQVVIAMIIALFIMRFSHIGKPYWCGMTVLYLFAASSGESNLKAVTRTAITIIGGILASIIVHYLKLPLPIDLVILAVITYFLFYYLAISYVASTFFGVFFVVYIYLMVGQWNSDILLMRIYETAIGAAIVIIVSSLWPIKTGNKIANLFESFLKMTGNTLALLSHGGGENELKKGIFENSINLNIHHRAFKSLVFSLRFEKLFKSKKVRILERIEVRMEKLMHSIGDLSSAYMNANTIENKIEEYKPIFNCLIEKNNEIIDRLENSSVGNVKQKSLEIELSKLDKNSADFLTKVDRAELVYYIKQANFHLSLLHKWTQKI